MISQFKKKHVKFLKEHPEKSTAWFLKTVPERPRGRWLLKALQHFSIRLSGKRVLDLCGGYGAYGAYVQSMHNVPFTYTVLDENPHRIKWGPAYFKAHGLKEPRFLLHDVRDPLPLEAGSYDVVWLFAWCDPLFECKALFSEVYRVLTPGGSFMFNMARPTATKYKTRMAAKDLRELLEDLGFKVLQLDGLNSIDYVVLARKGP